MATTGDATNDGPIVALVNKAFLDLQLSQEKAQILETNCQGPPP
jgi:predicted mannosyl-3-phosphoglycerate phosphatase (HAD superfamily)